MITGRGVAGRLGESGADDYRRVVAHPTPLEVLLPPDRRGPLPPDDAERTLTDLYRHPGGAWLRANMISTLDGAATGPDGVTGSINGPADHRVFASLRALADVIVVGAGTVRAEAYRAPRVPDRLRPGRRERGQPDHPALAILTRSGHLPQSVLTDDPSPWVFTTARNSHLDDLRRSLPAERLHVYDADDVDLAVMRATLADAGLTVQLTEGGPRLLAALLAAGQVDELCLTWSPSLVGGAAPRILDAAGWLDPPANPRLVHLLHADGFLIGRWVIGPTADGPGPSA